MPHTSFLRVALRRTMPFSPVPIRLRVTRICGTSGLSCRLRRFVSCAPTDQSSFRSKSMMERRPQRGFVTASSRILATNSSRYGFGGAVRRYVLRC